MLLLGLACIPAAWAAAAQAVSVTFQVRMGHLIEQERFDPGSDFVDLAGTFNGWGSDPLTPLSDADGDEIYEVTLDGFTPSEQIEYKFRLNGQWDGTEEFPGIRNNREYTVSDGENLILVWYNNEVPSTGPPIAGFEAHPRSVQANGLVAFEDLSAGAIDTRHWTFAGGSPGSSMETDPIVVYTTPGTYDVTLIVSGATESDTLDLADYIEVRERDASEIAWWNDCVFYEIFVRSFYDSDGDGIGDLQGLTQKLDYLNDGDPETATDLGITGIWLMPINASPSYHGYDVVDYRSINPDYGTMADFATFLDAAHARGIRVIIDYVMNHSSSQHPWFQQAEQNDPAFRDYYRWSASDPGQSGPWGQDVWHYDDTGWYYGLFTGGMPDLNYETQAVRDSMFATASYWLETVGVDGFRLDAVLYIQEDGDLLQNTEETYQFWHDYNQHVKQAAPEALSVGEAWTNTSTVLNYVTNDRLDFCFEFDLAYATLNAVNWGDAQALAFKAQEVYELYPHLQFGTFLTNHDQDRALNVVGHDENKAKVAAALYLTLPGIPFLYYGEEIGMVGSGPHPVIRRPMQWTGGTNAGFTSGTPWTDINENFEDYNVLVEQQDPASLLAWYDRLIALRNDQAALRRGEHFTLGSSDSRVIGYLRRHEGEKLLVVANTSSAPVGGFTLSSYGGLLPPGDYTLANLLDPGDTVEVTVSPAYEISGLTTGAYEVSIYEVTSESGTDPDGEEPPASGSRLLRSRPSPFHPATTIEYELTASAQVRLSVHDIAGRRLAVLHDGLQTPGQHDVVWAGVDERGRPLGSGVYFAHLETGGDSQVLKLLLLN
jgi:glycosidase